MTSAEKHLEASIWLLRVERSRGDWEIRRKNFIDAESDFRKVILYDKINEGQCHVITY